MLRNAILDHMLVIRLFLYYQTIFQCVYIISFFLKHASIYWHCQSIKRQVFFPHEVKLFSIFHNTCPHIFTLKCRQGALFLLPFQNFYAVARNILGICFEFCFLSIPHCLCTDLKVSDVTESSLCQ